MFKFSSLSPEALIVVVVVTGAFVLLSWWAIKDALGREFSSSNEKFFWLQLAVLVPFLGGFVYLLYGRKRGKRLK